MLPHLPLLISAVEDSGVGQLVLGARGSEAINCSAVFASSHRWVQPDPQKRRTAGAGRAVEVPSFEEFVPGQIRRRTLEKKGEERCSKSHVVAFCQSHGLSINSGPTSSSRKGADQHLTRERVYKPHAGPIGYGFIYSPRPPEEG